MGKPAKRSQWALVIALLVGAVLLVGALLHPDAFTGSRAAHAGLPGSSRGRADAGTAEATKAPAAPAAATASEEPKAEDLPPYGDRNLPLEESIRGRVLDGDGKPVTDAVVVGGFRDWRVQPSAMGLTARVRSEADGLFVLGPLERQTYSVFAQKPGAGVAYASNVQVGAWVDLTLVPGAKLEGTVTARETGQPVVGAMVIVSEWAFRVEAKTDANGNYVFSELPPPASTWQGFGVVVVAEGLRRGERTSFVPRSGRSYRVDFALEKGGTLSGRVVDREQRPLAGATVAEGLENYHRSATTDADGRYALENVSTAPNLVFYARADGFLAQQRQSDGTGSIDFELASSLAVGGVVMDRADKPVKGARIYLHRVSFAPGVQLDQGDQQRNFTTSGEGGAFRFESVQPGQVAVVAFHRDHGPGEKFPIEVPVGGPGPNDVRVRLTEGLTVEGEVRDRDDKPLPSVTVQMQGWEAVPGFQFVMQYRWQENPITCSDPEGKFRLKGALPGKQWLYAYSATYGWAGQQLEGSDGQRVTDVKISFAGGAIEGRILTAEREPVSRARVNARGPKDTPQMTYRYVETDGLGRFRLGGLPEGRYDIYANLQTGGGADPALDIQTGTTDVEIVLKPVQTLQGLVRSASTGRPLERFFLSLMPQQDPGADRRSRRIGTRWQNWIQSPDGRFEMAVMPAKYQVTVKAPGHEPKVLDNVIVEELVPPGPLDVVLDAGGGIEGTLRDPDGKPIGSAYVQARLYRGPGASQQSDWVLGGNDQTDDRGRFFLEGLAAGTYILQANMGERGAATARVSVAGSEMVRHDLALVPTGQLRIKAVDEEGKGVRGIYLQFMDDDQNWVGWAGPTDQNGDAQSEPMRAGVAVMTIYEESENPVYTAEPMRVEILSGRIATVEVKLKK
ncbi:MAG TPA: carboxypeptidase-like regulatory domain-containing protein [Planctomycetota bacterium]|nr:carboxypeptidase-like regulatory domain-containing protein [Planctomycetota bacterium]